ncbi:Olfactory receptor 14C36, partial [Apaloderma vittatum]
LDALLHTANTFSLPLCQGNAVGQFFCEIPHILKLCCSDSDYLREAGLLAGSVCLTFGCFVFMVVSYVGIFRGAFAYLKPPAMSSPSLDLVVSVLYSVVPPAVNPLIYSLRSQELRDGIRKLVTGCF